MDDILKLPSLSLAKQIAAVERGFPSITISRIAAAIGLPKSRLIHGLRLVPRTVAAREKTGAPFSPEVSERLLRVVRSRHLAREIFSTDGAASAWMTEPDRALGGKTPLEMMATDIGSRRVEALLKAMIHGVPV